MEQNTVKWLRTRFSAAPTEGPASKKVKFSDVHQQLEKELEQKFCTKAVSHAIKDAFPLSYSKPAGKSRQKHVFGIVPLPGTSASDEQSAASECDVIDQLQAERTKNEVLQAQIQQLEMKVKELEQAQRASFVAEDLSKQIGQVIQHGYQVVDGPNTLQHFHDFSLDSVISELRAHAPDVHRLFMTLGGTSRNVTSDDSHPCVEETRAIASLCTLLKACSVRVKGIQLLLAFMLIARATHRQVSSISVYQIMNL